MGLKEIFSSLKSSSSTSTSSVSTVSNLNTTIDTPSSSSSNNHNSKRNLTNSNKKNRYNLHNFSLDNDLLDNNNCILINKTNLNTFNTSLQTSPQIQSQQIVTPINQFVPIIPHKSSTLSRRESTRSNASVTNNNEPTRLLIENHARHVNSILNINSQTVDYLNDQINKQRHVDTITKKQTNKSPLITTNQNSNSKKITMITSPSCDVALLANSATTPTINSNTITNTDTLDSITKTPDTSSKSTNPRTRIKTNPWIRSPSFHTTPTTATISSLFSTTTTTTTPTRIKTNHTRSHTNDDIISLTNNINTNHNKRFNKLNLSVNKCDDINISTNSSLCKKCNSIRCSCLQKSKDSGISSIISNNQNKQLSPSPVSPKLYTITPTPGTVAATATTGTSTSSSSNSISSLNKNSTINKPSPKMSYSITTDSLEQIRNNDDYSILFEEALESSSNDSYSIKCENITLPSIKEPRSCNNSFFKRNNGFRYSLDQNLMKRNNFSLLKETKVDLTANFVAEVTNLFDKALLELPDFTTKTKNPKSPILMNNNMIKISPNPVNNEDDYKNNNNNNSNNLDDDDDDNEDDIELENSVNELYKQIEILKEQKKMLDEKMKIAKQETIISSNKNNNDNSNICKFVKEIRL